MLFGGCETYTRIHTLRYFKHHTHTHSLTHSWKVNTALHTETNRTQKCGSRMHIMMLITLCFFVVFRTIGIVYTSASREDFVHWKDKNNIEVYMRSLFFICYVCDWGLVCWLRFIAFSNCVATTQWLGERQLRDEYGYWNVCTLAGWIVQQNTMCGRF